jgi:hypothetical protein
VRRRANARLRGAYVNFGLRSANRATPIHAAAMGSGHECRTTVIQPRLHSPRDHPDPSAL